ncbi:DNA repair protein XRCC2 [Leptopilina heterotoma]|uniref:DNA repair protein XRCC2 n=1 Tax=Leptopilina heterotoma TaxID=63436 RepID=UPI001CA7FC00|nr:DNA repair protein XRCC2 [Leptopilina heterotoma]XP_043470587.1 DNA repair protein XRCC2 [Leptopilina heterotoma]XP_043470588.1 DNA repair protein XRCC2 [Leptopilina heterotoma]
MTTIIESGIQFLAWLAENSANPLKVLDDALFPDGLGNKHTVEINGDPGSGKTHLLAQLIASCILPPEYNGSGINVLLINADNRFPIRKLARIMTNLVKMSLIKKSESLSDTKLNEIVKLSLKNLLIINCLEYYQFNCNIFSLPTMLGANNKIGIVAVDSICAFYWQDRQVNRIEQYSLSSYVSFVLKKIQQSTAQFKVKIIFTKPADYESLKIRPLLENATNCERTFGEINHRIGLTYDVNSTHGICKVQSAKGSKTINYKITDVGIKWLDVAQS